MDPGIWIAIWTVVAVFAYGFLYIWLSEVANGWFEWLFDRNTGPEWAKWLFCIPIFALSLTMAILSIVHAVGALFFARRVTRNVFKVRK